WPLGNFSDVLIALTPTDVANLKAGLFYINTHNSNFPNGEIRGQFGTTSAASSVQFNSATVNLTEGGSALLTVTRFGDVSTAADVDYATSDGTATAGVDYVATSGTLHFNAGETFKTFTSSTIDDIYVEGNETFKVALSNAHSIFLGSPNVATITIVDNDVASAFPPQLILEQSGLTANQATAFESLLFLRDPFKVQ